MSKFIPQELLQQSIYLIRDQKVMIDRDLAVLYGVETRTLNQAVKRNIKRFPDDFMFQLTREEMECWKSQIVISNRERMGLRRRPLAFTEQGIAMLSSVLNSEHAILVNVEIMRSFVRLRKLILTNASLARKIKGLEKKYDKQFKVVFEAIYNLMETEGTKKKRQIGFNR